MIELTGYSALASIPQYMLDNLERIEDINEDTKFFLALEDIETYCDKLLLLSKAQEHITMYGITGNILKTYSTELLNTCAIELTVHTDAVVALEGISDWVMKIYNAIRDAIDKIIEWIRTDSYFSRWTNKCERYRVKIGELMATVVRQHSVVNELIYRTHRIVGHPYSNCTELISTATNIANKLNTVTTTNKFGELNIIDIFGADLLKCGFTVDSGVLQRPTSLGMKTATIGDLLWNPQKVYATGPSIITLLSKHTFIDKLIYSLKRSIRNTETQLNSLIRTNSTDPVAINNMKKEIAGMKCIRMISVYTIDISSSLAYQWINMANKFTIAKGK